MKGLSRFHMVANQRRSTAPPPSPDKRAAPADVRLDDVCKRFGDVWALHPATLSIRKGEFYTLLGSSGSGKTTTLRLIAGFEEPTSGRVFLQERDVSADPPYERNVNTVFQDYALFPHMTVAENVGYGLKVRRVRREEINRRVAESLELVRLAGFERRRPAQLSGGQRQRVALARALINVPALLLLDEPLGALDLKLRREMQAELKRIQRDVGITFLYVTHDQEEAMSMSDRIAVMNDGLIIQVGAPADVYEHPANAFVAGFVGVSNLLEGVIAERIGEVYRVDGRGLDRLLVPVSPDLAPRQPVVLTVRPEKIRMQREPVDGDRLSNRLRGQVADVSYAGAFTRYSVMVGDREVAVVEQNEGAGPRMGPGEEVWLSWTPEQSTVLQQSADGL